MRLQRTAMTGIVLGLMFAPVITPATTADAAGFGPRTDYPAGDFPVSIAMADLNGDSKLDLVVVNQASATVSVLLGDGAGGFGAKTDFATGEFPSSVAIADLNADNKLDLAVAATGNHPSGGDAVSVLLGNGDGTFAARIDYPTGKFPLSVAIGDMNGDHIPDLVVAAYQQDDTPADFYGAVSVLLGNGDGTFDPRTDYKDRAPYSVRLGDVNGDGYLDAVTPCTVCGTSNVLLGDGAGGLGPENRYNLGVNPIFTAVGDLNGDTDLDLVNSNLIDNTISVQLGDGTGTYPTHTEYAVFAPRDVVIKDVDGDGKVDLVVGGDFTSHTMTVFYGDGAGGFPDREDVATGNAPISVAAGDVNGDGKVDLANSNFNEQTASVFVAFPNDPPTVTISGPASGTVVAVGTPLAFTGSFTDETGDTHTAEWTFDSITQPGSVNETNQTVSATHSFTDPGVYFVTLTVTDNHGESGSATTVEDLDAIVVVYDPSGGFVTGGGWIDSPAGAYVADPDLTGKANFGFESKYKKGASTPSGKTEFQFKVAGLSFRSADYDWLVVANARAMFKGTGAVNGAGSYSFMLTAIDGAMPGGGGSDRFRIKIWDKITEARVYDNQLDAPDGTDPITTLGGGSIVIHTGGASMANSVPGAPAAAQPSSFALHPAAPNPMLRNMQVRFDLPSRSHVNLTVYDPAGRQVATLAASEFEAGRHARAWDGRDGSRAPVGPGIYFVRMEATGSTAGSGFKAIRKIVVMD